MADPTLQITVTQGPDEGKKLLLEPGKTYHIGCGAEDHLVLTDPMVLKGHCSLEVAANGAILRNHTASAGTFIGEKKVAQARIPAKATFRIGDSHIQVRPAVAPKQTGAPAKKPAAGTPGGPRRGGPDDPLVGKIVGGYKLLEVVGRGGMGTVYKAVQLSLQREVALKVLARKYARDDNFRDLFINEARAAAQLVHPNIVQVYDAGSEGDVSFFSMEYISQGSVEEILQRDKQIPWEEAILMVLEAAHGLEYAEGKQIVHRDIKPDNLMLNADGRIKIADLGLAKQGEGKGDQGIIGTPHFIPPEQALGKQVDSRADIYSLGATFFRMITGRTLFTGKTAKEIVLKHIKEPAPAASSVVTDIPGELDAVIARMLAKEPDSRFASASDLVSALENVCAHHGIKGSVIKKGVSKKVLIPLFLLLIGATYAIYHFAMKDPVVYEDPKKLAQQKADREAREKADRAAKEAQRNLRRSSVVTAWGQLELEFAQSGGIRGVQQHRDEEDGQENVREAQYEGIAKHFDAFAEREDVKEFDGELGYIQKATDQAKEIRDTIKEVKDTVASKRKQIGAWVEAANALYKKERDALGKLSVAQQFSDAYVAAEKLSREKPLKGDPFEALLANEWVSPINPRIKQSARDTKRVTDIVAKAREFFGQEKTDIPDRAEAAWKAVAAKVPAGADIAAATDKQLDEALVALAPIIESFGNKQPKIKDCWDAAQSRRRLIQEELKKRKQTRVLMDRATVRDTLRSNRSLDPDALPNNLMMGDFADAKSAWQRLLDNNTVKTERYEAFVRERIEALRYIEFLFSQFRSDLAKTDTMRDSKDAPLRSRECEFAIDTRKSFKFKLEKPESNDPTLFWMSKKYKGEKARRYGDFGMDWVYHSIFREPGGDPNELRWRAPTPVIRFSLAVFLFETMQYADAVEMFDALAGDETYGVVAKSFAERARTEAAARAEYEGLLKAAREAKTSDEVKTVLASLTGFGQKHAATLFWVDVMPSARKLAVDIAPDTEANMPVIPAAPDPVQ